MVHRYPSRQSRGIPGHSLIRRLVLPDHHGPFSGGDKHLLILVRLSKPSCTNGEPSLMNQYIYIKNAAKTKEVNTVFSSEKHSNLKATWQILSQMGA